MPEAPTDPGMPGRFRWHPAARLRPGSASQEGTERAAALRRVFAAAGAGREFQFGAHGATETGARAEPGEEAFFRCETSGSTGAPRVVRRSQSSWLASFEVNAARVGTGPRSAVAVLGGLGSSLGLYASVEALHLGADLHLLGGLRPDRQLERLADAGIDLVHATPAQLRLLASACRDRAATRVRRLLVGGGPLDAATHARATALFPAAEITPYYGASETSFIAIGDATMTPGSVGRAFPGVAIEIRGEQGAALPAGAVGEIWAASPYLFDGYAEGCPGDTRRADGFVTVGEMGSLDAAGCLHVVGRRSRMVLVADTTVFLDRVEAVMLACPRVSQAGVVAVPDRLRGHVLAGFFAGEAQVDAVLRHCREALGPLAAPRSLDRLADWPMLATGKTDIAALARRAGGAA
jgi:long-chain acyl-CoA synthetase